MMAYKNNFAVAIKHNGKILRDRSEVVRLPFGSEYSVLLKNKDSRKAVVQVEIDGVDVIDGNALIVGPNDSVELKGFMKGSTVRNKFKFIEKTRKISKYRGDRIDDGLVRVEYKFERRDPEITYWNNPSTFGGSTYSANCYHVGSAVNFTCDSSTLKCSNNSNDDGITVKGSRTKQDFEYGSTKSLESTSTVIILKLRGRKRTTGKIVRKPITVRTKLRCVTCGVKSRSTAKFCGECGTFLE